MSDTAQDQTIDLDTLTDDEVMNLGPDQIQALMNQEDAGEVVQEPVTEDEPVTPEGDESTDDTPEADDDGEESETPAEPVAEETDEDDSGKTEEPASEEEDPKPAEGKEEDPKPAETPEVKEVEEDKDKKPKDTSEEVALAPEVQEAVDFYKEITTPFQADGKPFQVKSAAEAVRLMQMGSNYSRKMQEIKPLKAMDAVLKEHGLDNPDKLAQLIDISKGDPAAIQKLLKEKGIDPLDIDVSKDSAYKATPYKADEKTIGFKEAIATTLNAPGGKELIADMNSKWDQESKDALFETPQIFEEMLNHKSAVDNTKTSDYSKINAEVERQRVLGYLTDVPFLQAYTQVSDAMANIDGLLTSAKKSTPAVPAKAAPIGTGVRKAAVKPKTEQPNPNLSSNPPKTAPSADKVETDYSAMSDEDFLKLGAPG